MPINFYKNPRVLKLSKRFEKFNIQIRAMITLIIFLFFYLLWSTLINRSLEIVNDNLSDRQKNLKKDISDIETKITDASKQVKINENLELNKQIEEARKNGFSLDEKISEGTKNMVSPKEMRAILEFVVSQSENMTLVRIDSLSPKLLSDQLTAIEPSEKKDITESKDIVEANDKNKKNKSGLNIFEHGISIELSGDYFSTLNFLKELEKRRLNIVWDQIEYTVEKYPLATIKILLHTLSLERGWIGV